MVGGGSGIGVVTPQLQRLFVLGLGLLWLRLLLGLSLGGRGGRISRRRGSHCG